MITLLLLAACSDHVLSTKEPDVGDAWPAIAVTPDRLDFWNAGVGDVVTLPLTVASVGETSLRVESIVVEGDASFTLPEGGETFDLLAGEAREVPVAFTPLEAGDLVAAVIVRSDDPELPEVRVPLTGVGNVPNLVVTPASHDFGELPVGCADTLELTLQNVGTDTLEVTAWSYGGEGYTIASEREPPFELEPYAYVSATVTFSPLADGDVTGELSVESNDPHGVVVATQTGAGLGAGTGEDHFTSVADPPVDILLVVDRSGSMDDDAANIATAFDSFINTLGTVTSGWHLGVVTTDSGCFNGGLLTADAADLATTFGVAVVTGDDYDIVYDEALFQIADAALRETAAGGCNEGFLRERAPLHVVFVSDEPERSTEIAVVWTWDWYLARWLPYVASPDMFVVSGVVDTEGCNEGYSGYAEMIGATGGQARSICGADWAAHLAALAEISLASAWTFPLSGVPVPDTLVVMVDGVALTGSWHWDEAQNAVIIDSLEPGQSVDVTYTLATECA